MKAANQTDTMVIPATVARALSMNDRSSARCFCPRCGEGFDMTGAAGFQRAGILISSDPVTAYWKGEQLDLSPMEHAIVRLILLRGRASFGEIDAEITAHGSNPANRSIFIWRIRAKLKEIGAPQLFYTRRNYGIMLRESEDLSRRSSLLIGVKV